MDATNVFFVPSFAMLFVAINFIGGNICCCCLFDDCGIVKNCELIFQILMQRKEHRHWSDNAHFSIDSYQNQMALDSMKIDFTHRKTIEKLHATEYLLDEVNMNTSASLISIHFR